MTRAIYQVVFSVRKEEAEKLDELKKKGIKKINVLRKGLEWYENRNIEI